MGEKEMMVDTITISTKEYKKLVEAQVRINLFAEYVKTESYSIGRKKCAAMLGFELKDEEEE